jgi:hypothetical protein
MADIAKRLEALNSDLIIVDNKGGRRIERGQSIDGAQHELRGPIRVISGIITNGQCNGFLRLKWGKVQRA